MAPLKRKSGGLDSSNQDSNKRPKFEKKSPRPTKTLDDDSPKVTSRPAAPSVLAKEQPSFPRGGAGLLTLLERKQIHAKANRDALAELEGTSDLFGAFNVPQDSSEDENGHVKSNKISEPLKKKGKKKRNHSDILPSEHASVRIEGLKFKHLTVGSLLLGQVTCITSRELTIALPNNFVGYVPLTSISQQLNEQISQLVNRESSGDGNQSEEVEDIDLKDYFYVGQYLRLSVTSTGEESVGSKRQLKRRIELSVDPRKANSGLKRSNLATGCTVQVSVISVEDHGLIVDLGLEEDKVRGFVPTSQIESPTDVERFKTGAVFLCLITDIGSNGKTVKLSGLQSKLGSTSKPNILTSAPTVDTFLPGTAVEVLISDVTSSGMAGKVMGLLDVTADVVHSQACTGSASLEKRYTIGKKIKGRLLYNFALSESKKIGFSILPNILSLQPTPCLDSESLQVIAISSIVDEAKIIRVEPGLGVYLELAPGRIGFAHISRLSDSKVDSISDSTGAFKVKSKHETRVLEYNPVDNLFIVTLEKKIIRQPFLRVEDVQIGQVVKGQIGKVLIDENGIKGLIIDLADGVDGYVPSNHFSDIKLQHPEKKFREGVAVTARVLSKDVERKQIRLTLKKTLVNTDQKIWQTYSDISVGDSTPGTLIKVDPNGALVQFYGPVKGYLPVAEMSEAFIKDATEHFREGQVVKVTAINVNPEDNRMTVSCRDFSSGVSTEAALASLSPGMLVNGNVFEKSQDDLLLRLDGSNAVARLSADHIADGSLRKRQSALGKIRVGQTLQDLVVLEVQAKRRLVLLCNRASIVKACREGTFLKNFEDLKEGLTVTGFVTNITPAGVFVGFGAAITGLVPKSQVPVENQDLSDFGFARLQPITARVLSITYGTTPPRFWLSMREGNTNKLSTTTGEKAVPGTLVEPVDDAVKSLEDFNVGKVIKVRIVSVKETQINVELAKDVQGRIDISEVFDNWDEIKDRKKPLRNFSGNQTISVRILGAHDARNHKYLPISHRSGKTTLYELSARPSLVNDPQTNPVSMMDMQTASSWVAFVNNVGDDCIWVNISPSVRGRIRAVDAADDLSLTADLEKRFPVGSALRVRVISVDIEKNRLDLSAKTSKLTRPMNLKDLSEGSLLPGRITKVSDRQLLVQLGDNMVGAVDLIDMDDDYAQANPAKYQKNELVRVRVVKVDAPNKKVNLSIRPSKVLSSSLPVVDTEVTSIEQVHVNEIYRGFVSNVAENGLFVILGHGVTAFVRVTNLSDAFLKEWKDHFQRDQLVKGKILNVDKATGQIQMSLKESVLSPDFKPPVAFTDLHVGDFVTGKIVKVEAFGVFILVDNSANVRGLCHRSEIAEHRIEDATSLFSEGDIVKAKVLKVDLGARRINFGMKASYFTDQRDEDEEEEEEDDDDEMESDVNALAKTNGGVRLEASEDDELEDSKIQNFEEVNSSDDDVELLQESGEEDEEDEDGSDDEIFPKKPSIGLGFDWQISSIDASSNAKRSSAASDTDEEVALKPKKKRRGVQIQVDRTGELDANGPQSVDDFERLLLSEPDSSLLWIQYMAFYMELGDFDQARKIAERGLRSIGLAQDAEKMNVWIALLNLENADPDRDPEVGREEEDVAEGEASVNNKDSESGMSILDRACMYNDPKEIYSRLASIYVQSDKHEKADELFQKMVKKFAHDPKIWVNYATFLFDTVGDADKARALLPRALQTLPSYAHIELTSKFAQLEFRSQAGIAERGRTIFEGLMSSFPKRVDLVNVLLDLEIKAGDKAQVRALFERIFAGKVKAKQAKFFFKRWLAFEEENGDERSVDKVKSQAAAFVRNAAGGSS